MKKYFASVAICMLLLAAPFVAAAQSAEKTAPQAVNDITGLYSFLHEGEFVQIEVNDGKVTGLVSHFKNEDPDKTEFVDQYFSEARYEGTKLTFRTKPSDGLWYEFSGDVERGSARSTGDEGYWLVRGVLVEHRVGADGKSTDKSHSLTLKSFPQDADPNDLRGVDKKE